MQHSGASQGASDLGDLDAMSQARAIVVALMGNENLRLVLEAPKRRGMNDAIAVALKIGPRRRGSSSNGSASRFGPGRGSSTSTTRPSG